MSVLTKAQLEEMLRVRSPQEILSEESTRLDDAGKQFLQEREANPTIEDVLRRSVRHTQRVDSEMPAIPKPPKKERSGLMWWTLPTPLVLVGATCCLLVVMALIQRPDEPIYRGIRDLAPIKRLLQGSEMTEVNHQLFLALKKRGIHIFERAETENKKELYEEAYQDLEQAYQLEKDPEVLDYMRRAEIKSNELQ